MCGSIFLGPLCVFMAFHMVTLTTQKFNILSKCDLRSVKLKAELPLSRQRIHMALWRYSSTHSLIMCTCITFEFLQNLITFEEMFSFIAPVNLDVSTGHRFTKAWLNNFCMTEC
jgi:hypothetical protein